MGKIYMEIYLNVIYINICSANDSIFNLETIFGFFFLFLFRVREKIKPPAMQVRNQKARAVSNEHIYLFLCYNGIVSQSL